MNLNPFDLPDPQFLLFFLAMIALGMVAVWFLRRAMETGDKMKAIGNARDLAEDPYCVAFLRGGRYEVLSVALVALIEKGLLKPHGEFVRTEGKDALEKVSRPLDKAILSRFALLSMGTGLRRADSIYRDPVALAEADLIGEELEQRGLLPDNRVRQIRRWLVIIPVALLWTLAAIKIGVALSRGRTNVGFLLLLAVLVPFLMKVVSRALRTRLGDQTFGWIQSFFENLWQRRRSFELNRTSSELTFLAAVFGISALPDGMRDMMRALDLQVPKTARLSESIIDLDSPWFSWNSSGSSSSGSWSSCGSGSSCGGGGGCGGGGCGGCGS